jgi:glycosyltransferase involved in cell wall biosynthesis
MKILILHGSSDLYGASKILLVTVETLKKNGHEVTVVLSDPGPLAGLLEASGIEIIYIRLGILRRKYKSLAGMLNRLWVLRKAYAAISRLILDRKIDFVYSNTTAVLAGAFAARKTRRPHIWHIHEILEQPFWLYRFLGNILNRYSDKLIVVSDAVKKSWARFVDEKKIHRIYNGIDYSSYLSATGTLRQELRISTDTVLIGMIGRVHPWKGQDYFLEIAKRLSERFSNLHFVMIGDAFPGNEYLYAEIAATIERYRLGTLVSDLGYQSNIPPLLHDFDILVLPSVLPDPFPTVILEAMAAAKPVVATAHGGAQEMLEDGITGVLIPLNNAAKAAAQFEQLILDKGYRERMGRAGRQKVLTDFPQEAFEKQMIKIFE